MAKYETMTESVMETTPREDIMVQEELPKLTNSRGSSAYQDIGINDDNSSRHDDDDDDDESEHIQNRDSEHQEDTTAVDIRPQLFRRPCSTEYGHSNDCSDMAISFKYPTLEEFQKIGAIMNMDQLRVPELSASDVSSSNGSQTGSSLPILRQSFAWSQDSSDQQDHHPNHHDWYPDQFYSRVNNSFTDSPTSTRL
jgi:hypothetical protein